MRTIGTGGLGGKANGIVLLASVLDDIKNRPEKNVRADRIKIPFTTFMATDVFDDFVARNKIRSLTREALADDEFDFGKLQDVFIKGVFSESISSELSDLLALLKNPLAVRSSSLLEDQKGASFAGKYETVFVANCGSAEERLESLRAAIARVYASTYNPKAVAYRRKRGLIDSEEKMAVIIQEIVGTKFGKYYLPALAGVGFSQNGYSWNREIASSDGLVRIVFGLGSRAVGRGYVRLFSPAKPGMRPEGTDVINIQKCSQKNVDLIDLEAREFKTVHFRELIKNGFDCFPGAQAFVSLRDGNYIYHPVSHLWDSQHIPVLTLDEALNREWMGMNVPHTLGWLLKKLEERMGFAVDLEFAINADPGSNTARLFLLQVRPLAQRISEDIPRIPDVKDEDLIFKVHRNLPTAYVPDIEFVVYVDESAYQQWPFDDRPSVARAIGKINKAFEGKRFMLVGPGRWGSWNAMLGVPVNYSEISNCAMLAEIARRRATYVPEVSFGSHFFQDLIEDGIAYLPLYPDEPEEFFNEKFFQKPSCLQKVLPDEYFKKFDCLIKVIRVPDAAEGCLIQAILDGERETAVVYLGRHALK